MCVLHIIWILSLLSFSGTAEANGRHRRELKFPRGGSFVAAIALASLLPKGPTDGLAHVLEFDLGFPFPEHFAIEKKNDQKKVWKHLSKSIKRGSKNRPRLGKGTKTKRSLKEEQRHNLLLKIEDAINRIGFNGSSCISRFQCELQSLTSKNSLLEEIVFALFKTFDRPYVKKCKAHCRSCPVSLLHALIHSEQISPPHVI